MSGLPFLAHTHRHTPTPKHLIVGSFVLPGKWPSSRFCQKGCVAALDLRLPPYIHPFSKRNQTPSPHMCARRRENLWPDLFPWLYFAGQADGLFSTSGMRSDLSMQAWSRPEIKHIHTLVSLNQDVF